MAFVPSNLRAYAVLVGDKEYVLPHCPPGAGSTASTIPPGSTTYTLSRQYEHMTPLKRSLLQQLYPTALTTQIWSVHDLATGQYADPKPRDKFGTTGNYKAVDYWGRRTQRRLRMSRLLRSMVDGIEVGDLRDWNEEFMRLYSDASYQSRDRLVKYAEELSGETPRRCDKCGEVTLSTDTVYHGRHASNEWCFGCVEDAAEWYEHGEYYVCSEHMVGVTDDNDGDDFIVPRWVARRDYYQHEDGEWHTHPEPEYDSDDDSGPGSTPELYGYHQTKSKLRGWRLPAPGALTAQQGCWAPLTIGIELEVDAVDCRYNTVEPLVHALRRVIGADSLYAEEDGSLDEKGFELIFGWSDLHSWQRAMPAIGEALNDGGIQSYDSGTGYGLHVNVAVPTHAVVQGAITWFINNKANESLLYALARRAPTAYCTRTHGVYQPDNEHRAAVNFGDTALCTSPDALGMTSTNHWYQSTIASFRLFRGTTSPTRLMACIEFCHSLVAAATEYSYRHDDNTQLHATMFTQFTIRYWQTHVLKHITCYPTLVNYLRAWDKKHKGNPHYEGQRHMMHHAFTDYAMTRFISQYPMGMFTGAPSATPDRRALSVVTTLDSNALLES